MPINIVYVVASTAVALMHSIDVKAREVVERQAMFDWYREN